MGRGVTAAYLTFNQAGVGSNPSDPTRWRVAQRREQRPYKTQVEGSIPSAPTDNKSNKTNYGTEVLLAAHLALNQASEGSNPSGPTDSKALVV